MDVDACRAELGVLDTVAYLNTGTFGPLPRRTLDAMTAADRRDFERGRTGGWYPDEILDVRERVRARLAAIVGADADSIALTRSTTEGCNIVAAGLRLSAEDEVVTTDAEHFGLLGPLAASGAHVRVASVRAKEPDRLLPAIEAALTPHTRLIALSHVTWTTGQLMPAHQLARLGVPLLLDGAQSVGAIPVSVEELGCDFLAFSGQKWLLGPGSTGGLYVRQDWVGRLAVAAPSYYAQQGHRPDGSFDPRPGARRFDSGWLPPSALEGLLASIDFVEEAGDERFGRARAMAERCRELLAKRVALVTPPGQGTLVSWEADDAPAEAQRLAGRGVVVRSLPGLPWLRASIGYWTSDPELERLASLV